MPLVGRTGVVEHISGGLDEEGSGYVLAGPAGVGKSRLATEAARAARGRGLATLHVAGTKGAASIPFGAFAALMPEIVDPPDGLTSVLQRTAQAIVKRADPERGLLIVVDDAHLLDDGSAALVHQLAKQSPCRIIATIRSPAPTPDPITALWKDELAERLDIDALARREVEELVTLALGGPLTDAGVGWLYEVSAGNPLYLREVLIAALDSGALRDEGGVWTLRASLPSTPRLVELVAARLTGLSPETAEVVDLVAIGEPLPVDALTAIVPPEALEDAERRGIIRLDKADGQSDARMEHPIFGEVRRQEILPFRMRRLCAQLAAAMENRETARQGDELRIARWQLDAGSPGDPHLLGRAAMAARRVFDLGLATRLARASLDAGGGIQAGLALAEADFFSGRPEEAEKVLAKLEPQCVSDDEISRVANARAYNLGQTLGDQPGAMDVVVAALAVVTDPAARHRLLNRRAVSDVHAGRTREALADARELIASGDHTAIALGTYVAAIALALLGRGNEATEMANLGIETVRRVAATWRGLPACHRFGAVIGQIGAGRLKEAEENATVAYEANAEVNAREGLATFATLRGWVSVEQGQMTQAVRLFREGVIINRELGEELELRWCLGGLALASGMARNAGTAASAIDELAKIPPHWMDAFDPDLVLRGRAWALAAGGELSAARRGLWDTVRVARKRGQLYCEARVLHDLARLGEPREVADRLMQLAAEAEGDLVAAFALDADALARQSATGLEQAATSFERLGAIGLAAETFRAASGAFAAEGLARPANACARKAAELADQCGMSGAPGIAPAGPVADLTRREREIALLAGRGLSSREISDRLFISVRTVENHLAKIYLKLGVTGRQELAAALTPS
jgi:DNA-binding CsgD family transcriptional regulator